MTGDAPRDDNLELKQMNVIGALCAVVVVCCLYLLPWIIAKHRKHHNSMPIFLVNFFFGVTVIGWLAALIWACTSPPPARG
jgi:quinol-cytochrome oxidoreductase complex cytochrome b subunit